MESYDNRPRAVADATADTLGGAARSLYGRTCDMREHLEQLSIALLGATPKPAQPPQAAMPEAVPLALMLDRALAVQGECLAMIAHMRKAAG